MEILNYLILLFNVNINNKNVQPSEIRDFIGTLTKQPKDCVGFLVSNVLYSKRSKNEAEKSKYNKVYLTTKEGLIKIINEITNELKQKKQNDSNIKNINFNISENSEFNFNINKNGEFNFCIKGQAVININNI